MSKKVLLLFPRTGFDSYIPRMPSSLIYIGTYLKERGYEPIIIDSRVEDYKKKILENKDAIAVGITTMTGVQVLFALKLAKFIRENLDVPIIWGGVHPSLLPHQTLENEYVDYVVKGEGEKAFYELVKNIEEGKEPNKIQNGKCIDLDLLPFPDYSLVDVKKYNQFDIISARGCPSQCTFCYNHKFNNRMWRGKSAKKVLQEIKYLIENYNIKYFNFLDDNFFTNKQRAIDICNGIIERGLKVKWKASCRIDYLDSYDDEFINLLKRAGLCLLMVGAESGSQKILDSVKKGITIEQMDRVMKKLGRLGLKAEYSFMIGFPYETYEDLVKTFKQMDLIKKVDSNSIVNMLSLLTPCPGTEILEECVKLGYQPPKSLEGWGNYTYTFANLPWLNIRHEAMSYVTRFVFYNKELKEKFITRWTAIPFLILSFSAKFRWKHKFFGFPLEWWLFKKYLLAKRKKQLREIE